MSNFSTKMNRNRKGISLLEVIISTALVGLTVVPSLAVFATITGSWNDESDRSQANSLASQLLTNIQQLNYENVDDYNGFSQQIDGYSVSSAVQFVSADDPNDESASDTGLKRIRVEASHPRIRRPIVMWALKSQQSSGETPLPAADVAQSIEIELRSGSAMEASISRIGFFNQAAVGSEELP